MEIVTWYPYQTLLKYNQKLKKMKHKEILGFLSTWATELNSKQKAGALVNIEPNGELVLSIKNKLFQPFICICRITDNNAVELKLAHAYDYRSSILNIITSEGQQSAKQNYLLSSVHIKGQLASDTGFLSALIAAAANSFFAKSIYHHDSINPLGQV